MSRSPYPSVDEILGVVGKEVGKILALFLFRVHQESLLVGSGFRMLEPTQIAERKIGLARTPVCIEHFVAVEMRAAEAEGSKALSKLSDAAAMVAGFDWRLKCRMRFAGGVGDIEIGLAFAVGSVPDSYRRLHLVLAVLVQDETDLLKRAGVRGS